MLEEAYRQYLELARNNKPVSNLHEENLLLKWFNILVIGSANKKMITGLEQQELMTIWHSAQKFYAKVHQQDRYVPPEVYNIL